MPLTKWIEKHNFFWFSFSKRKFCLFPWSCDSKHFFQCAWVFDIYFFFSACIALFQLKMKQQQNICVKCQMKEEEEKYIIVMRGSTKPKKTYPIKFRGGIQCSNNRNNKNNRKKITIFIRSFVIILQNHQKAMCDVNCLNNDDGDNETYTHNKIDTMNHTNDRVFSFALKYAGPSRLPYILLWIERW